MTLRARLARLAGLACAILLPTLSQPSRLAAESADDLPSALQALESRGAAPPSALFGDAVWRKRQWIEKTARLLRGGEGLGPSDDIDALLALPEEAIVRQFMADPRFGDTILDFNMYFLGFKVDQLKSDGVYLRNAFDFPNAVAAAQALLTGGNYLKLFELEGPFFMAPLPLEFEDPLPASERHLWPELVRIRAIDEMEGLFAHLVEFGATPKPPTGEEYCNEIDAFFEQAGPMQVRLQRAFNDAEIFVLRRGQVITAPLDIIDRAFSAECADKPAARADVKVLAAAARRALERFQRGFAEILKHEPSRYRPQSVLEFKAFDLGVFDLDSWLAFGFEQGNALKNSSTNFNRKRGAYILKRYFCDDLTPVGFETPQQHVSGAHGSDTGCYACHYKLDPMAGFFRNHGVDFFNYAGTPKLVFDDDVNSDRRKYSNAWRAPEGAPRRWNVGYIRSPRAEQHNDYGRTINDLSRIIAGAPEAKRCLMRRLFEYLVAENQAVDGAYLDDLTRKFTEEARENSSAAMKNAIVRIAQSNAYRKPDADPRQCYDRAGARRDGAPPCSVAFILEKNCAQCHGSNAETNSGLDLTKWVAVAGGNGFPHFDGAKRPVPAKDTLERLIERLSTPDPDKRMPKQKLMPSQDRQALFLWAQEELARVTKGGRP